MNYRHAFHAGNFADVHKHVVLALIVQHLLEKPTPFRILDTHAGAGLYDLRGEEAGRTGEWRGGIGRLLGRDFAPEVARLLAPYREAVLRCNPLGEIETYPGSPVLCRQWLRPQDRLVACELEPGAFSALAAALGSGRRAKAVEIDGWTALKAYIPPPERRGLVLVDPPYERSDEFSVLAEALIAARRKWPTGIYLGWYPIKDRAGPDRLAERLARDGMPSVLRSEFVVTPPEKADGLAGSGLVILNPPWGLEQHLSAVLPPLALALAEPEAAPSTPARLDWIARPG
jgi:23S rRNA (adenine2030-N6)-methyltransferase